MRRSLNLIFLGPPGAGKGTYAARMAEKHSIPQISTGSLMRSEISSGSSIGVELNSYISEGKLVPDDLTVKMLLKRLECDDCKKGYILDGFPRTLGQAETFEEKLKESGNPLSAVVVIEVDDQVLINRLADRRVCSGCGATFHLKNLPPKVEGKCDLCTAPLTKRKDDSPEVIKERLKVYHDLTEPLIDFYKKRGKVLFFDGDGKIDVIYNEICAIIDRLMSV
ncbi:MAG: adenylate kinase [Candidatus Riflebacteria bacterium]|nr:adenylate kinase [Candidatus Riflebacteria bacterium]